ncbi:MAG: N-acetylmuramic acid 6-phosphate etherase [Sphingorhabdus sp.]|jgi:N-acetylmuramic acid 6-phosphate etherase|uniref:N-acetylmuramic acid 6-phosphate etherase n=1 Tax=Sphingorhabdus sp. TaxID=1902408 RepID=UPI0025FDA11B|nr:N-acetylmuramic acid 6-phosphate etherase [Sphingorhabdus sp.]MCO4092614.1 N-acetylmuramic acid 6-phosphate etherase [Sphingorhabdus sp.]
MPNTESLNPRFSDIDSWPTIEAVEAMLEGQMSAIASIKSQTQRISAAAEAAAARLQNGGRLVYVGAGTSGRVAVQDGVELGPTFGWPSERLLYLMAGGIDALVHSAEGAEDDADDGRSRVRECAVSADDVVIGVAASGRTPFTIAALNAANDAGALTIAIVNNAGTDLLRAAQYGLLAATGSEAIAGSTRMKAGTAQKAILNLLSTAIMLRLDRVYRGLMVDMVISNDKLLNRAFGIVKALSNCSEAVAMEAVVLAQNDIKTAVLIALGKDPAAAAQLLREHGGILRDAVETLDRNPS